MEVEDQSILSAQDYAIMQAITILYGMYEAAGNTAMKEDMRERAVSIRQKDEYSGKYSNADDGGSYVDSYEYHSEKYQNTNHLTAVKVDTEYITQERIYIHGGNPQTFEQKSYEVGKTVYTLSGLLSVRSVPALVKELVIPDDPIDILDNANKIASISGGYNYVGKHVQEGDVCIRVGNCYQGSFYWFRGDKLWYREDYDWNWFMN